MLRFLAASTTDILNVSDRELRVNHVDEKRLFWLILVHCEAARGGSILLVDSAEDAKSGH